MLELKVPDVSEKDRGGEDAGKKAKTSGCNDRQCTPSDREG